MWVCARATIANCCSVCNSFTIGFRNIIYSEKNTQCGCCFGWFCIFLLLLLLGLTSILGQRETKICVELSLCCSVNFLRIFVVRRIKYAQYERECFCVDPTQNKCNIYYASEIGLRSWACEWVNERVSACKNSQVIMSATRIFFLIWIVNKQILCNILLGVCRFCLA